jgi:hypothetical protein
LTPPQHRELEISEEAVRQLPELEVNWHNPV